MNNRKNKKSSIMRQIGNQVFSYVQKPNMRTRNNESPVTLSRKLNKGSDCLIDFF